jgi:signal transduction histidine kinase
MHLTLKAKAVSLSGVTVALTVLGVSIATVLLRRESRSPDPNRFYGVPVGSFSLLITLAGLLAVTVIALIWVDYEKHRSDEAAQRELEKEVARRTEQLLHANERLREMDRIKTELVHRVSHELRTPLTSIVGYSEVLLEGKAGPLSELQEDFLRTLSENGVRLQSLVDDILEISRWESGAQRMAWESVSLAGVVQKALGSLRPVLKTKDLKLDFNATMDLPPIQGDAEKLLQMVNNLLDNAVKYTPSGGAIEVTLLEDAGGVQLTVQDTGVGIPEEFHPRLFEKFERASNVTAPAYSGTGLGLYLVKQIVESHRGEIEVESALNRGTRIRVGFPAEVSSFPFDSESETLALQVER